MTNPTLLPTQHTDRLTLIPLQPNHADALYAVFSDPETMRFMDTLPHEGANITRESIVRNLAWGAQYWAITIQGSDEPLGYVGFMGGTRVPGMSYILRRDHWSRGITTEAMRAAITYGFSEKRLDRVELWINEGNLASQRVADKLGFKLKGRMHQRYEFEDSHHIMLVYGLRARDWEGVADPLQPRVPQFVNLQPVLPVHDVRKTAEYYRDKLGFDIDFLYGDPPDHGGVGRGDWSSEGVLIQLTRVPEDTPLTFPGWLYIMVESEIDALHEEFVKTGAEIDRPPQTYPWGMREFQIRDCNGYVLRFGTHAAS